MVRCCPQLCPEFQGSAKCQYLMEFDLLDERSLSLYVALPFFCQ